MKKLIQRLLVFFIGLPLLIAVVFFLPHYDYLALKTLAVLFSALGAVELSVMFRAKGLTVSKIEAALLGGCIPLFAAAARYPAGAGGTLVAGAGIALALFWILLAPLFSGEAAAGNYINRIAAGFAALVYPGFFLAWVAALASRGRNLVIVFLLIPIACDSAAWAVGMLFGKGNRGVIKISPNKSVAGFIGGLTASALVGLAAAYWLPEFAFDSSARLFRGIALGLVTGVAATLGDLCESAIKRAAGCKDSGALIPGRGGVLDSVDAIAFAAPVFYLLYNLLF